MSILEEIWCGEFRPDQKAFYDLEEYAEAARLLDRQEELLHQQLGEQLWMQYERISALQAALTEINRREMFFLGFCSAQRLILERIERPVPQDPPTGYAIVR